MNDNDLLKYAVEHGMIDLTCMQNQIEMNKRNEWLSKHPYKIWEDQNGIWHTYLPDENKGRVPRKRTTKKALEDVIIKYWKKESEVTIKDGFYAWLDRNLSYGFIQKNSYQRYVRDFQRFFEDERKFYKKSLLSLEPNTLCEFILESISKYNLTSKGYGNLRTIVNGIFKYAKSQKWIDWSISQTMKDLDIPKKAFRQRVIEDNEEVFDDDEILLISQYITDNPDVKNLGILLLFCTGLRIGELVALKWSDVTDFSSIKIRRTETFYNDETNKNKIIYEIKDFPKTEAGVRTAVVPKQFQPILKRLYLLTGKHEFIFTNLKGERMKALTIRKRLYRICDEVGIKRRSPNKMRKTYASILLDNKIDVNLVESMMGHTQITTTEMHYHRNRKSELKKQEILSQIPEFSNVIKQA